MGYKYVLQNSKYDCGIASLRTVFLQFNRTLKIPSLKIKEGGISAYDIIKISEYNKIKAKGVKSNLGSSILQGYLPCIAHVKIQDGCFHYIVILANNHRKQILTIHDPTIGILKMSYKAFNKITTGVYIIFKRPKISKETSSNSIFLNFLYSIINRHKIIIIKFSLLEFFTIFIVLLFNFFIKELLLYQHNSLNLALILVAFEVIKNYVLFFKGDLLLKLNNTISCYLDMIFVNNILMYNNDNNKSISTNTSIIYDIETVKKITNKIISSNFIDIVFVFTILLFSLIYNYKYFLFLLLLIIIKFVLAISYRTIINNNFVCLKQGYNSKYNYLLSILNKAFQIKSLNMSNSVLNRYNDVFKRYLKINYKYNNCCNKITLFNDIMESIFFIIFIFILSSEVKTRESLFINVMIFYNIYLLFLQFLDDLCQTVIMFEMANSSINNSLWFLKSIKNIPNPKIRLNKFSSIAYKNVSISNLFDNVELTINKNDYIFINKNSNSNETVLLKLLLKEGQNYKGDIEIEGINIKQISKDLIDNLITYISYATQPVKEELYDFLLSVANEDLKEKIELLFDFDKTKDNVIKNPSISYIKICKVLIGQALLKGSKVIILDEILININEEEERNLLTILKQNFDITVIVISSRNSNLYFYNKQYILKNKNIHLIKEEKNEKFNE